jgi:hypothetical protein
MLTLEGGRSMSRSPALFAAGIGAAAAAIAALGLAPSVSAHHSVAMYDLEHPVELEGKVVEWQFTNPHTFIILEVADAKGEKNVWELEGGNTRGMIVRGWTANTLQPGDDIVVTVRPLLSGAPGGNFSNVRHADGTPVGK